MPNNYQYIDDTGVIVPDTADIQTTVEAEYKAAFGSDLVVTPDTPQGVLITAEVLSRDEVVRNNAALANQINPNLAGGVFLDAICALTGLKRSLATFSVATCNLTGVPQTIIPGGVTAKTVAGDVFASIATVTLDNSGNATVDFRAVVSGPVPAVATELNQIVNGVLGWETISNPANAILGQAQQSDQSLRQLRLQTLALQGIALPEAITSALYDTTGVKSLTFLENVAATTQAIQGQSLVAHSIFVCVSGGSDDDVAATILANKSLGCNYNGSTTVNVVEPASGQTYAVKFQRPTAVPVLIKATVTVQGSVIDPNTAVPAAILSYINGEIEGEQGFVVGGDVSPFEIGGAVNKYYPTIYVKKVEITLASNPSGWSTDDIAIAVSEIATATAGSITVIVV